MRCTSCGTDSTGAKKFCAECGSPLSRSCPKCGAENAPTSAFCEDCGTALAANAAPAAASSPQAAAAPSNIRVTPEQPDTSTAPDGERKTVTALFADIKGSMELMEDLDPEEARSIIDPALRLMIDAVRRYDGYVVQSTGDGIFALFGAPVAHEDHPQRALYAALRLQEELKRYSDRMRQDGKLPLQARVGVNTGELVVRSIQTGDTHTEYTPIGHTANLAARMQVLAPIGSIAATDQVRKLCEGYFLFKGLGPTKVKGVSEPVNVYEVTGLGPLRTRLQHAAGRGLTKFVGRDREMDALKHAAEQAKSGHGQIAAAMAEPGVGKSRLFFEFKATSQSGWMVLESFSVSHGKASAYLPVMDLLRNYFRIANEDDERTRREKVTGRVVALDRSLEDTLPYLFSLLGIVDGDDPLAQMDGQIKKRRTLDAIKRIVLRESLNQPLMVIFEDLHWIDGESQALLNLLVEAIANAPVLLLVNYRPEYRHEWGGKTYYNQLRLDPLGLGNASEMLTALLGEGAELAPLKQLIIEKTEGNPFFMEEMVQALFEQGVVARNGSVKLERSMSEVKIPPTVQGILAARIDRLPADEKDLLQTLAVIGKEFPLSVIERVVQKSSDELERMLSDLQLGEFIYEQPAFPEVEYTFKHALTQDVAYNSVLSERRKALHERTARAIELLYSDHLDDHLDGLAHHYSRSTNLRKAVDYLNLTARQCAMRSAHLQALTYLNRGLELAESLPEGAEHAQQELALQIARGWSLYLTQGYAAPEVGRAYGRARELCVRFGDNTQLFSILDGLRLFHRFRLELQTSRQLEDQLVSIAEELNDPAKLARAHGSLGTTLLWMGELVAAHEHFERVRGPTGSLEGVVLSEALDHEQVAASVSYLALDLAILGFFDQAMKVRKEVLAWAQKLSRPHSQILTLFYSSVLDQYLGDVGAAQDHSASALAIAAEFSFPNSVSMASVIQGWVRSCRGETESGVAEMVRGIAGAEATGMRASTFLLVPLVETYVRIGRTEEADRLLTETLETVHQTGHRMLEAELYRLKGELLLKPPCNEAEAETCFRRAIEIARHQSAKWWELRATMSLARLLDKQCRRDEARAMLANIYNWFTEGFDTADLKDAKALLDELNN